MDPVTIALAATAAAVAGIAAAIDQYNKILLKNHEIETLRRSLQQYTDSYAFEECDRKMIAECSMLLKNYLGGRSYREVLEGLSADERVTVTRRLARDLADKMRVKVAEINIVPLEGSTLGSEIVDTKGRIILHLNSMLLESDPDRMLFVMLHELRHAVQDSSLRHDVWGFSDERKAQWLISNQSYIVASSQSDYVAYVLQIVENDANQYADTVLKSINIKL